MCFKRKKLTDDAAKALAVILGINAGIRTLYLNENNFGDTGAIAIGKAILMNKESNLKTIYMYNNTRMTLKGEKYLQKVVFYSIYHDLVWLTDRHINVSAAQTVDDMNHFYLPSKQNRLDAFAKGL